MRKISTMALASVAALTLVAAACGGGDGATDTTPTNGGTETTPPAGGGELTLTAVDNEFQPATLTATADQQLTVTNTGAALHNFMLEEAGVDFDIQPGESETEDAFEGLAPGEYEFVCKYHESLGMVGTVTISG